MAQSPPINPNSADAETLQTVPGIGPALANRIIALRPFTNSQDLLRVSGISETFLAKIEGRLTFDPSPEPVQEKEALETGEEMEAGPIVEAPEELSGEELAETTPDEADQEASMIEEEEEEGDLDEADVEEEPPLEDALQQEPETPFATAPPPPAPAAAQKEPSYITRGQAFWMSVTAAFFAFILAVALTLALLSGLNRGLRFATPDQLRSVQSEVRDLQGQADSLDSDLAGLRTRMDNFEALGGRVSALETDLGTVQTDLQDLAGDVETIGTEVEGLSETVDELIADTNRFQSFLEGLTELLLGLSPEGSNE